VIPYLRFLSGKERSREANRHLGFTLAFVAGALNAGAFLAVARYTSHVTGLMSSIPDNLAVGKAGAAALACGMLAAFIGGGVASTLLMHWARRQHLKSQYALALMAEAVLLLAFGLMGANAGALGEAFIPTTVVLLSFTMGLQNALITKLSGAEIRTTHMTGNATDLGIELGKALYMERRLDLPQDVEANMEKLKIHACLLACFLAGGFAGAWAFQRAGFYAVIPLAGLILVIAAVPIFDDLTADEA
jgi:uncharacterized membrane protein YoaK (UPF0700 family)